MWSTDDDGDDGGDDDDGGDGGVVSTLHHFRLTLRQSRVDLIKPVSNVRLCVYVHLSTNSSFDFS